MNKNRILSIALDGPGGAGKSSVAKRVAKELNASYLDTGAMYRAVGLYMVENEVSLDDKETIALRAHEAKVDVKYENGQQITLLNGMDVTSRLREMSKASSAVAKVRVVRELMVEKQREIGENMFVVMDGRDIGTVVLPNAALKVFITAEAEERAKRRQIQLQAKGIHTPFEEILADLIARDKNDTTREESPLKQAEDAVLLDTTHMTEEEVVNEIIRMFREKTEGKGV